MSDLLKIHEDMIKAAQVEKVQTENVDVIVKYATAAEELLTKELKDKYNEEDVIKVAEALIDADLKTENEQEKVAEYDQLGRIMARSFLEEIEKSEK